MAVSLLCLLPATGGAGATELPTPSLFGSTEIRKPNISIFPKYIGMMQRFAASQKAEPSPCVARGIGDCRERWLQLIERLRDKDVLTQLREVNAHMNRFPYIEDIANWGVSDYWATPHEFFRKDGDCEDYAIAKYYTLALLGVPREHMRLVVLQDENLRLAHAILVVYVGGKAWVLDNQIGQVVEATRIFHYRPIYSINETGWWFHRR
ncbi:MAG: transglutaminase-like cysteine peptidase [Alphaproteobacteria bacterium]